METGEKSRPSRSPLALLQSLLAAPGRLRLWHQFAAVGLLAVGLPLGLVAWTFLDDGGRILRDHEIIDLADEGNLRAADVRDDVAAISQWLAAAARRDVPGDRVGALAAEWERTRWTPGASTDGIAKFRRRHFADALVALVAVKVAAEPELLESRPAPPSASGRAALADLSERLSRPEACYVSGLHRDGDRVLFAVGRAYQRVDGRPTAFLAAVFDLSAYLDARGRVDARHLYLLAAPDGTLLYHPKRKRVGSPLAEVGWNLQAPEAAAALATDPATRDRRLAALAATNGARLPPPPADPFAPPDRVRFPSLRFYFLKGNLPGGTEFGPRFGDAAPEKLADLTRELAKFTDGLRVRCAEPGVKSQYLELAADDPGRLADVRKAVDDWWAAGGAGGRLAWSTPLDCRTFHGQLVPLRLDPADTSEPPRLIVAASQEELSEDIDVRFWQIVWRWVLPSLGAAVAVTGLLVWALTRSLRSIAHAAETLSARPDAPPPAPGTGDQPEFVDDQPPPTLTAGGSVEVAQLAASLTALYDRLRQANSSLDGRVKVRTAELAEANGKLEAAVQEARTAARAKDAFLANMSHELRNPLHIILGFADELRDVVEETGRPDLTPDLDKIRKAGKHLLQLINDILDLAKIEAGKMELTLAPVPVRAVVNEVRQLVEPLAAVNKNTLTVDAPPGLGRFTTDDKRVKQILINLLSNAFKFTDAGTVTLSARRVRDQGQEWVRLAVRDTGKGLTPAQLGRLFERFYQADDTTTRKQGGTGLGLSICQALAERLGAKPISVTSQPGKGSEFVLELPADPASGPLPPRRSGPLDAPPVPAADGRFYVDSTRTVLVIDDDAQVRELMERFLTREGFGVRTAGSAADGLRLARLLKPACITLDVMMPGTDGWQALADLKSHAATADIPVVMLTIADDRARGFALGAADYLTKPIDWPRLAAILRRYHTPGADRPVLVVDDDAECRELVRRQLESEGWRVTEAADGDEGLTVAAADPPAAVLLDLMMPGVDGFGFLDELPRRFVHGQSPPVVVLTAKDLTADDHARLTGRVSSILAKGDLSHLDELVARVRVVAGRPAGGG